MVPPRGLLPILLLRVHEESSPPGKAVRLLSRAVHYVGMAVEVGWLDSDDLGI